MPLLQKWNPANDSAAAIWNIEEPEAFFAGKTALAAERIRHPKRRIEHLAGRFLLHQIEASFPVHSIEHNLHGKPMLPDESLFFSVSHSFPFVACIVSASEHVGIDIQRPHANIAALSDKFLTLREKEIIGSGDDMYNAAWTAKEAAYKLQGLRGVDFKQHLCIETCSKNSSDIHITIKCNLVNGGALASVKTMIDSAFCISTAHFHKY